jgi:recombination protein RecT
MQPEQNVIKQEKKQISLGEFLKSKQKQIAAALPKHMNSDKVLRIAMTEIARNPKLKECSADSLATAIIQSSQLGLFPDSILGEAYLIPYVNRKKNVTECQFQVGYQGMLSLAYRSGEILNVDAQVVHENDKLEFTYGTEQKLKFIPEIRGERGEVVCYYAIAHLKNGGSQFIIMSKEDINKHRNYSKTGSSDSPWATNYDAMAKKTCIKSLLKYLPRSAENMNLIKAISLDDQADLGLQDTSSILFDGETGEILNSEESKTDKVINVLNGDKNAK